MSAHADDLRYYYAEHLGQTEILSLTTAPASKTLEPGRYAVRYRNVSGAAVIWVKQRSATGVAATAAAPSTPFDLSLLDGNLLFTTMVRKGDDPQNVIEALTNAGTADLVLTKISRDKT